MSEWPRSGAEVWVVLPVYNEERILAESVGRLHAFLRRSPLGRWRIVIADNGSEDGTREKARQLTADYPEVGWTGLDRKGRGRALKGAWSEGAEAGVEVLAYMDVDLSTDLESFMPLISPLLEGRADLAIGSRLLPESVTERGLKREAISRCYNALIRRWFGAGFSDAQCGFKGITRQAAKAVLPEVEDNGWFFDTELILIAAALGYRIHEVPVRWRDDPDSRVWILRTAVEDLKGLARVRRRLGKRKTLRGADGGRCPSTADRSSEEPE